MMNISLSTLHADIFQSLHFLHIPKTAGTSLRTWLMDLYREEDWLPCHFLKELEQLTPDEINKYHFFSGHLGNTWYGCLQKSPHTFTWLRQPIAREISQYFYLRNTKKTLLDMPLNPYEPNYLNVVSELTLTELCRSSIHLGYYDNLQVRFLTGNFPIRHEHPVYCDETMLEIAKEKLLELFFFGLCESMNESMILFNYLLGCPPKSLGLFLNKSNHNNDFSHSELTIIEEANFYDQQLYDYAQIIFKERFHDFLIKANLSLSPPPEKINIDNPIINDFLKNNFYEKQKFAPHLNQISFDFSESLFINNWYPRFYYEPVKKWLRWAGPNKESFVYLPLAKNVDFEIFFKIFYVMSMDILDSLALFVNDRRVALNRNTVLDDQEEVIYYEFNGLIDSSLIDCSSSYTELKFLTSCTISMEIQNINNIEVRHVSFATDGLTIRKA